MLHGHTMRRRIHLGAVLVTGAVLAVIEPGCLDRPVTNASPTTQTNFTAVVDNETVDKIDLLFIIDNSASMGDKQQYLAQAVPNLVTRLVTPNCVDPTSGTIYGPSDAQGMGTCTQGKVEFPPVHDMHIGILSSSLGSRLSDQYQGSSGIICDPTAMVPGLNISNNNDDRAELLNRSGAAETPLADAGTSNYLNWFPANNPKNMGKTPSAGAPAISDPTQLTTDFTALIQGIGNYGCGIESQLEGWYRFLVQPDPYDSLSLDSNNHAQWVGVDTKILAQRANFLRPDSLVAIIDMTDENDSEIDVRSIAGQGYLWMSQNFDPPRGTSGCAENSADNGLTDSMTCNSCQFASGASTDPSCMMGNYSSENDWGFNPNLRHVHMQQKYGLWPQFPIQRYVLGLTSKTVPDRNGEYPPGPPAAQSYQGLTNRDCTNPLFAASLPDGSDTTPATLCNLPVGPRTPDLIYYAHIGGVPFQLLQQDPTNPNSPPKETLADSDWTLIVGNDPLNYDYTGIDPHMIESYEPRTGIATPSASGPPAPLDADNGYDWVTNTGSQHVLAVDREYACTFQLTTPRDCTDTTDPTVQYACDCPASTGLTPQELPPICNPATPTQQIGAKTYPTQRELLLAKLMGGQGFISSLCPIHVAPAAGDTTTTDPLFGYNPAVNGIVDRLKTSLTNQCLPQQLTQDNEGNVPCLILVQLATQVGAGACANPGSACNNSQGLLGPGDIPAGGTAPTLTQDILTKFCQTEEAAYTGTPGAAGDPDTYPTCALQQLTTGLNSGDFQNGSCAASPQPGWCYVVGAAANGCPQAILFTGAEPPQGATTSLQCIENSITVVDAGAD